MSRKAIFSFCLCFVAAGAAQATLIGDFGAAKRPLAAGAQPQNQAIADGMAALAKRDAAAAESAFQKALQIDAKSATAMVGLADVALMRNQPKLAWDWLQKALVVAPKDSQIHDAIGRFHYAQGELPQAEEAFKQAVYLDPGNVRAQVDLGDLYRVAFNAPLRAVVPYRAALKSNPDHAGARYALGLTLLSLNKAAEAEAELAKAAKLMPTNPLPRQALGRVYALQGRFDKALEQYDAVLRIQADFAPALVGKGDVHTMRKAPDQAIAEYQKAIKIAPKYEDALLKLAMAYQAGGRQADAEKQYLAVIESYPKSFLAYNNLAAMTLDAGQKPDQALKWARQAAELAPEVSAVQDTLGWSLRASGKIEEAEQVLSNAVRIKPELADVQYHLGMVYLDLKRPADAERAFKRALELDKSHAGAAQGLKSLAARKP